MTAKKITLILAALMIFCKISVAAESNKSGVAYSNSLPFNYASIYTHGQFEIDGMFYCIVDAQQKEVALVANHVVEEAAYFPLPDCEFSTCFEWEPGTLAGEIEIPSTVSIDNERYTVVMIGYGAFYGCANLTSVKIPSSIKFVSNNAFANCTSLENIYFEKGFYCGLNAFISCPALKNLDLHECVAPGFNLMMCGSLNVLKLPILKQAFCPEFILPELSIQATDNLKEIWSYSIEPPEYDDYFITVNPEYFKELYRNIILYVPNSSIEAYKANGFWSVFSHFKGFDYSSINPILQTNSTPIYFDMNGRATDSPSKGIYIERAGNKSKKIFIR